MSAFNLVNPITSSIRQIFMLLDFFVYYFLQFNFNLFFHIVTFNVVDSEMIYNIVSRVQLVVGIFMMFQLVMIIIKGIVNPDTVTDSKSGGAGNIIMRIIVSLALLALIVPINIPSPKNEYEKQINNNGILFGTLYSLQYRILTNNTLGKLILGSDASDYTSKNPDETELYDFANRFTTTILRVFYPLNVDEDGNYICQDGWDEEYYNDDREPLWIISQGARKCGSSSAFETYWDNTTYGEIGAMVTGKKYAVSMSYLTCTIVGLVIMILVFVMTFSVAKRVFQLAALQLLAPIPIISYMDPKGSKDGAFNSWLKLLGKTYLDLFIRIGSMYFAIGVIQAFMDKYFGSVEAIWATVSGTVAEAGRWKTFSLPAFINFFPLIFWEFIIIVIGLLLFAIEAPKFIKQMLGVKDDGKGFFSDFGMAMGLGVSATGALGSFQASRQGSIDAEAARLKNQNPNLTTEQARAEASRGIGNRARNTLSGLFGAGVGLVTGSAAASESKGNAMAKMMASVNAMNTRNQKVRAAGRDGGTLIGGVGSLGQEVFGGQNEYDALEADWKAREEKIKGEELVNKRDADINAYRKAIMDRVNSKAVDKEGIIAKYKDKTRGYGEIKGNYRNWHSVSQAALVNGVGVYEAEIERVINGKVQLDAAGNVIKDKVKVFDYDGKKIKVADVQDLDYGMLDAAKEAYYQEAITNKNFDSEVWENKEAYEKLASDVKGTAVTIEDHWGIDDKGIKAKFGEENRRISKSNGELSRKREAINSEKQGYEGQRAAANAKRFRK